ncbi:MAG: hypothetical protein HY815_12810 [Candidatus Riflebacteria bacterium]|nr:hypothetical protein [Candidatus Riflebacteria bacterium]
MRFRLFRSHATRFVLAFGWVLTAAAPADAGQNKDLCLITGCGHRAGCTVEAEHHPSAGDIVLEQEGLRYADFDDPMAFARKVMEVAGEKPVLSLKVRRGSLEVAAKHGADDGVEFKTVSPTARRVPLADAQADVQELFEALERVYIDSHRTREPWYPKARSGALTSLHHVAREGRVLLVDLYAVLARFLSRFDDGHLDVVSRALTSELDTELYVEGRLGLPLRLERYGGRYYISQPGQGAAPVEVLSIDGTGVPVLIDRLAGCVSGDTKASREDLALRNFSALHYLHVARDTAAVRQGRGFDLVVGDRAGSTRHLSIPAGLPLQLEQDPTTVGDARSTGGVDVLTLNTFDSSK